MFNSLLASILVGSGLHLDKNVSLAVLGCFSGAMAEKCGSANLLKHLKYEN